MGAISTGGREAIVRSTRMSYGLEDVRGKIEEYKWEREEFLTFLVLARLGSVEINGEFEACGGIDLERFKGEFSETRKKVVRDIYERNVWFADRDDEEIKKLVGIREKIGSYVSGEVIEGILRRQRGRFVAGEDEGVSVLSLLCSLAGERRDRLEMELILGEGGDDYRLMTEVFRVSDHYRHVERHKDALFLVY